MLKIRTLIGHFDYQNNLFKTIDNQIIPCYAYRHISREITDKLVCVNIKYVKDYINALVIFQYVLLDDLVNVP